MKLIDRINIGLIFQKHKETFYNYGEANRQGVQKATLADKFTFLFLPAIFSVLIVILGIKLTNDYINIIITSLSIFVGLLFNLLVLIFDLAKKQKGKINELNEQSEIIPPIEKAKYQLVKELYANISFAIALSILAITAATLPTLKPQILIQLLKPYNYYCLIKECYLMVTNVLAIVLVIEFLLVLLMILKRFFLIFNNEME